MLQLCWIYGLDVKSLVAGNGIGDTISNPGQSFLCSLFTNAQGKGINPSLLAKKKKKKKKKKKISKLKKKIILVIYTELSTYFQLIKHSIFG